MVRSETGHSYPPQELLDEETFIVLCDSDHPVPRELQEEGTMEKNKEH